MIARISSLILLCLLIVAAPLMAGKSDVGTTAYPFLKIGVGAKALSMGGAFVGLADDESTVYYNPAGIINFRSKAVSASYMNYIADIQSGHLTFILPSYDETQLEKSYEFDEEIAATAKRALAISINYLNYGTIDETNSSGEIIDNFSGSDIAISLSTAWKVAPRFAVAGTAKFIYQKIDEFSSDAIAVDLGLLYHFRDGRTALGISGSNLGFQLSGLTSEHKDPLPVLVRAGFSHRMRGLPVTVVGEGVYPSDNDIYGSIGAELSPPELPVALRLGYSSFGRNYKTGGDKDNLAGFSAGAGFIFGNVAVDYAFLPYADLGSLHRISFAHRW